MNRDLRSSVHRPEVVRPIAWRLCELTNELELSRPSFATRLGFDASYIGKPRRQGVREQRSLRLAQLKRLLDEVDRLPPSRSRSLLLRKVRDRVVSVDADSLGRPRGAGAIVDRRGAQPRPGRPRQ